MYTLYETVQREVLGAGVSRKILSHDANMMAVEVSFESGAIGAPHEHPHEQIGYVVSGSVEYQEAGKEKVILRAGDSYYVPPHLVHGVVALEKTVLLDVFTPRREDFLKK